MGPTPVSWPDGRRFAFSIFDDTDWTTLENGPLIYDFLTGLGFRITKSVWMATADGHRTTGGAACDDPDYLAWVRTLVDAGHEIGLHNVSDRSSPRAATEAGLDRYHEAFGHAPRVGADHAGNREALYWGPARLSGLRARAYHAVQRVLQPRRPSFSGHDPASPYFWGDLCRDRIDYYRNFTFAETNVLRACPTMPYHDPARPYVNHWFASTDAPRRADFVRRLAEPELDRLEAEGGLCIVYTHLGLDFVVDGELHPDFVAVMTGLARRSCWSAPVGDVLDRLRAQGRDGVLDGRARRRLERRWVVDRLRQRRRFGPRVQTVEA